VAGVVLRIDSPGGSPVQAGRINTEIQRLRRLHPTVPLHAVIDDICASGGYYVAVAADRIYADKASVVGSVGVLMNGFGFVGAMEKLGIERRLLTAGTHKGFLDPFSPENPEDAAHARELLQTIHSQFIDVVKQGRGALLKDDPRLFTGLVPEGLRRWVT
jgi:protease-4